MTIKREEEEKVKKKGNKNNVFLYNLSETRSDSGLHHAEKESCFLSPNGMSINQNRITWSLHFQYSIRTNALVLCFLFVCRCYSVNTFFMKLRRSRRRTMRRLRMRICSMHQRRSLKKAQNNSIKNNIVFSVPFFSTSKKKNEENMKTVKKISHLFAKRIFLKEDGCTSYVLRVHQNVCFELFTINFFIYFHFLLDASNKSWFHGQYTERYAVIMFCRLPRNMFEFCFTVLRIYALMVRFSAYQNQKICAHLYHTYIYVWNINVSSLILIFWF